MKQDDKTRTLAELKSWVQNFCEQRGWDPYHGPKDLAIGLVTESSELLELFRFVPDLAAVELIAQPEMRVKIADELADSLYFILRFAQLYGFDLSECLENKLVKNEKKYPAPQA
jgi:NTP pyrophosphatase (non-canonical NTP hydrolase)